MEVAGLVLNILVLVGLVVAVLLAKSYFPSYVGEKAKNLATKEDIAEITRRIEEVKLEYAHELETAKVQLQIQSSLKQAFQAQCLHAVESINSLLVNITLYCWGKLAERSPNEHYVWSSVDESEGKWNFHYFRVAIDKAILENGLYLTVSAKKHLSELSNQIGLLSSMELALSTDDPDPAIIESAESGYSTGLKAVEKCREGIMGELGLIGVQTNVKS